MSERKVKRPIIIVGAPRSGTTMLARIFAAHPEVAFWEEPRTIWEIGNSLRENDQLDESHLTSKIGVKIDHRFSRFLVNSQKSRFAEKTPTNVLRIRFIHAIYPDAKIIYVVRNGRASVASILKMRSKPARPDRVWSRLRETPVSGYPALILRALRRDRFLVHPAGWKEFSSDSIEKIAQQWDAAVRIARQDLRALPDESWIELKYEDLISDHQVHLKKMLNFCELEDSEAFMKKADGMVDPSRSNVAVPDSVNAAFEKYAISDPIECDR